MKIEVVSQNKNPLLKRSEVMLKADHSGKPTPSRYDLLQEISKTLKASQETIIIERIITKAGAGTSEIKVHVYNRPEDIPKHKLEKMKRRTKAPQKQEEAKEEQSEETGSSEEQKPEEKPAEGEEKKEEGGQEQ